METTAAVSKGIVDAKTRELNFKAQQAAKADIKAEVSKEPDHNIVTGAPLYKGKGKVDKPAAPKPTDKPTGKAGAAAPKKEAKPKLSAKIDELIAKGGKWEDLIAEATEFCKVNELKTKINVASFKTQIHWRTVIQKRPDYLKDMGVEVTDKGISKIKKVKK
jgi:cell division septation protein DedD